MAGAGFPSLGKLFPDLVESSYFRGRDVVMELGWADGHPEVTPHSRCTAAGTQHRPSERPAFPATTTWSRPIVRARSIDEEVAAAGAAAMEAAAYASNPTPRTPAAVQASGSSGRVGPKRSRQQLLEGGGDAGASGAAGRGASPTATLPGAPSSHFSRVEHVSYATTVMTYDDLSDSSRGYDDDTSLGPKDDSDQPGNDQEDSAGRRSSRSVRSKQICSDQRSDSKTNIHVTASMRERKRRDKFNKNIKLLQKIIPNTSKGDAILILDRAIDHLKKLQSLAQMVGIMGGGNPYQLMMPQEYMTHMMLAAQLTQTSGVSNGMRNGQLQQPPNVYNWPSFQYPPGFSTWGRNV